MSWYNLFKISQEKKIISFDFDSTLANSYLNDDGFWSISPNVTMINILMNHHSQGDEIIIVTSRMDRSMDEVREFVKDNNLPVSEIYNTNGEFKGPMLEYLGVSKHYDDDKWEIEEAKEYNIDTELVQSRDIEVKP